MEAFAHSFNPPQTQFASALTQPVDDRPEARDETLIIAAILSGETHAYHDLVRPYEDIVYRMAFRMLKNHGDAEDVAQETFLKAFLKLASFRFNARFSTWLLSIALNEARSRLRLRISRAAHYGESSSEQSTMSPLLLARDKGETPLEALEREELRTLLQRAISELPVIYRDVLRMRVLEEHSVKVTAQALTSSEEVVKVRLHRARRMLRKKLKSYRSQEYAS
jgi:RNA polymerase sigma-70 factor (ECF subfamily)